ncbi:PEP-CTERM sorting domain-containing protein [Aliiglaciecola litoralis]|uniref:Ice-binding protein C-terminal domain-containing protein n=1 Tax=Aliiglaciecola litoralis TaxID=582857 RepID=A0ABN1LMC7_9ALTE
MDKFKTFVFWAAFSCFPAHAGLVSISADDAFFLNVDFTSMVPSPPYQSVIVSFAGTDNLPHSVHLTVFAEFDGLGDVLIPNFGGADFGPGFTMSVVLDSFADVMDGVFSIGVTGISGTANWDINATATDFQGNIASLSLPDNVQIPEPATLMLVGLGLFSLRWLRWKTAQNLRGQNQ